jgi:pyruvate dehydrogenase E1 component alpha subunit
LKKIDRIVVCFFGDGAANEGSFHEALNLASVWKLPVLFVCENNLYGMSTPKHKSMNIDDIAVRATSYNIPGVSVDGNDVLLVHEETRKAREYVKANGPMLLVCNTYRFMGHSKSDANVYRTKEEINAWKQRDPIKLFARYLLDNGIFTEAELTAIDEQTTVDIENAYQFADKSALPSIDTIMDDVYA